MNLVALLVAFGCGLAVSLAVVGLVRDYANRNLLDHASDRSSHAGSIPRGGGVGLVAGSLGGALVAWLVGGRPPVSAMGVVAMTVALVVLAGIGWWDDHVNLSRRFRLLVHFGAAIAVAAAVGLPLEIGIGPWRAAVPHALLWPVLVLGGMWMVNLVNFMDGIDGIAGAQAAVGCAAAVAMLLWLAAPLADSGPAVLLGTATLGACLGFLRWNWPPARIFMGDVGSTFLGLVATVLILVQLHRGLALDLALLPWMPFIADATCTLVRRAWRRENLGTAHRTHLYQRLARRWGGHRPVTLLYAGLALAGGAAALATARGWLPPLVGWCGWCALYAALLVYGRRIAPVLGGDGSGAAPIVR